MKKIVKKVAVAFTLVSCLVALNSCGSNSSRQSYTCPICHKSLEGKTVVECTAANGARMRVCSSCYAVGVQFGKCI